MPHYIDGTEAKPGDIVRGKGYNIKDEHGELAEITALVLHVNPNATACNVTVLVPDGRYAGTVALLDENGIPSKHGTILLGRHEYGQCDHFQKV